MPAPRFESRALQVRGHRLMESLHTSCKFGQAHTYGEDPTETGMARLSLSNSDKQVRNWMQQRARDVGFTTFVDQMGNLFVVREGRNKNAPPIMMGSHMDTQPTGGRYDGILGVIAGLEVLFTLEDNSYETEGNIGVVDWTNEEGARFPMMAVSSGVWAGAIELDTAWNLAEIPTNEHQGQKTMREELKRIGYLGEREASYRTNPFAAHFELHIEQGPILELEKRKIGIVHGVQAFKWFYITIHGRDSHAGTTPLYSRKDAMLCAAKIITTSNEVAKLHNGLATTGIISPEPGSINTIPHTVRLSLDLRHTNDEDLDEMIRECKFRFAKIAELESEMGCELEWEELVDSPAVHFDKECIAVVEESAREVCSEISGQPLDGRHYRPMISGAGHDSCYTNRRCPTSMIFTPTKDGISHNPKEYCAPEDCIVGANVLLGAVLKYDTIRKERGDFR